jgi:hypothetical protein
MRAEKMIAEKERTLCCQEMKSLHSVPEVVSWRAAN